MCGTKATPCEVACASCCEAGFQLFHRQVRWLFAIGHFHPPHEAMRRNERQQRLSVPLARLVAIRRNPHPAVWLDQGHR